MSRVVIFPTPVPRSAPTPPTRADLGRLIDGLQVLALTRPDTVRALSEVVYGLLKHESAHARHPGVTP